MNHSSTKLDVNAINKWFSAALLSWFSSHGRRNLPWQGGSDPYPVWVSEIMLQQTQVETVIPYFEKFIARFPNVAELASAEQDDVMTHWAGLGYYARARNLHKAAQQIVNNHSGTFPKDFDSVLALPGIGRSTAGAILAFTTGQRFPILDGNVKRVLGRFIAISEYPGNKQVADRMWELADQLTPEKDVGSYTQAIMDLGATLCTRTKPDCIHCPVNSRCQGFANGNPESYPGRKPKKPKPQRTTRMLVLTKPDGSLFLIKRPPTGIWGGLWAFPEIPNEIDDIPFWISMELGLESDLLNTLEVVKHGFTHYDLEITPVVARLNGTSGLIMDLNAHLWYNPNSTDDVALPAAMYKILAQL